MRAIPTLTFTASGTWEALALSVDCQCTAEGGSGGVRHTSGGHNYGGGGGGGAEYSEETALALTIGSNYPYTIGQGGSSTNTVFAGNSVTVTANYGHSGFEQSAGPGGSGSTNSIHFSGTTGTTGMEGSFYPPGVGGDAAGSGGTGTGGAGGPGGGDGTAPGGGGGGGSAGGIGSGAAGQIVLIYTASVSGTATLAGAGTLTAQGGVTSPETPFPAQVSPGVTWLRRFGRGRRRVQPGNQLVTVHGAAALAGTGTLAAFGSAPAPAVVNQWSNSYGQGTTFTSVTSGLQSCVVPLTPAYSAGPGSGYPTAGNWLFAISSWTQDPSIINVHVGTGDDIHSYWREYPAAGPGGNTRTAIAYTANTAREVGNVYVAPDGEIAAINVLVVEVASLSPWDAVVGTDVAYDAASTAISLSQAAGASGTFFIGAASGDNVSSGQAFLPSGWMGLATQTQTNGANALADNILTAAYLGSSLSNQSVSGSATTAENLSGFMLAVLVSGNSPIPAGHNPNWPYLITEAGFGSGFSTPDSEITWTDVSSRAWSWDETTGIKFELGQLQSTDLTMEWDNYDAALTSTNTASPYYPNVQPGTPVRVRAALGTLGGVTVNRWYILQRNLEQVGEEIDEAYRRYCPVTGSDLWAALSATPPTFYRSEVYEDGPYAWWPCDDQPGTANVLPTQLLNAAIGNSNVLNIKLSPLGGVAQPFYSTSGQSTLTAETVAGFPPGIAVYTVGTNAGWMFGDPQGTPASLGTGNPETSTPGSAAWQASGQAGNSGSYGWYLICNDSSFPPLSAGVTIECWFNAAFYATTNAWSISSGATAPITGQPYNSPITIWEIATSSAPTCLLQLDTSGHLNLITAGTSHSIYTSSNLRSESWHMVTVTLTTTGWAVWLDGGANAAASGSASMSSAWSYFIANGDFGSSGGNSPGSLLHGGNIALSHIAIYPSVLPYFRVLDHYWAAVTAFGQLPAPTGVQIAWTDGLGPPSGEVSSAPTSNFYVPDGSAGGLSGGYQAASGTAISAIVVGTAPGGVTSGSSAWTVNATSYNDNYISDAYATNVFPWVSWTGVAPLFNVYTSAALGSETESAVVCGDGDSFTGGYGGSAHGAGVAQVSGGDGSSPPTTPSSIGDTVGQRIERLMNGGRFTSPNRCIDPAPLLVSAPGQTGGGVQAGAAVQAIQQSDDGMLFVDNCNHLSYFQKSHLASQYSSPVWQLGPSSGEIPYYREIRWVTDPQRVWNVITVTPLSPTGAALPSITPADASAVDASQARYGPQPLAVTSWLQSSAEQQSQANWLFSVYGTPQRRAENVKIEAAAYPAAWIMVMGASVGDVITLEDWQIGGGGTVHTYRITEIKRRLDYGTHNSDVTGYIELTCDYEPSSYWS